MVVTDLQSNVVMPNKNDLPTEKISETKILRRIIAEDPEWSLATVPLLKDVAINHIVKNFAGIYDLFIIYFCLDSSF